MGAFKLHTNDKKFNKLWELFHATRPSTEFVKVPRHLLLGLLEDHGELWGEFTKQGWEIKYIIGDEDAKDDTPETPE